MIPYTVERRADTGVNNVTLGFWLFLASEVMLFGALFSCYALLRTSAAAWPSGRATLNVAIGVANTGVLLVMTSLAWRATRLSGAASQRALASSTAFALLFLVLKGFEYRDEISRGLVPSVSTFFATYYTLTGLHALHVIFGIIANVWAISGLTRAGAAMTAGRMRALALYWTFVDLVWFAIFGLMYLT